MELESGRPGPLDVAGLEREGEGAWRECRGPGGPLGIQMSAPAQAVRTLLQARENHLGESEGQPWRSHLAGGHLCPAARQATREGRTETAQT